ncbi:MAG TPA: hypothetical protein VFG78_11760, partial [Gemmatimonadota bacterium]|nr:hypothetical protein [Gemmatimonadota bacterium]
AQAAATAHRAGEPIVAFHDWPRAFPFYLDERVITVTREGRETRFEVDDAWRRYIYTEEEAVARFAARPGALFYLQRDRRERLEELLGHRVEVLAATRRHLLAAQPGAAVSRRPAAASRPARPVP